mmetsp:Transcript_9329/g.56864  ORF Transcript_9329/g.56864 Transcript_9329/m.56864 type:complete len:127 (-) Transcript_9329:1013-1393(-)
MLNKDAMWHFFTKNFFIFFLVQKHGVMIKLHGPSTSLGEGLHLLRPFHVSLHMSLHVQPSKSSGNFPVLQQHRIYVFEGSVYFFLCLGTRKHNFSRYKDQQDHFWLYHSIDESRKEFWFIAGEISM